MSIITLQLKDAVMRRIDSDAMTEGLSREAFLESWLNDWYDFTEPATPERETTQSSWERRKPAMETLL